MPHEKPLPILKTDRLILRPFTLDDAPKVQPMAGDPKVADTTLAIPHPYPDGAAEQWINTHESQWHEKQNAIWAICLKDGDLVGTINLCKNQPHNKGWLGYWIGVDYWRNGYCTEAGKAAVAFGFGEMNLNRIYAEHLIRNPASGRVMQKLGMKQEAIHRQHILKNGVYEDVGYWAILRSEWKS